MNKITKNRSKTPSPTDTISQVSEEQKPLMTKRSSEDNSNQVNLSHDIQDLGDQKTIFLKNNTEDSLDRAMYSIGIIYLGFVVIVLFSYMVTRVYKGQDRDWSTLIRALAIFHFARIAYNGLFFFRTYNYDSYMTKVYVWDCVRSISFIILYYGVYNYIRNGSPLIYNLALLHMILSFLQVFKQTKLALLDNNEKYYVFLESVQIFLIIQKYLSSGYTGAWGMSFILYDIYYQAILVCICILGGVVFILTVVLVVMWRYLQILKWVFILVLCVFIWLIIEGALIYEFYNCFKNIIVEYQFAKEVDLNSSIAYKLNFTAQFCLFYNLYILIVFSLMLCCFSGFIKKHFSNKGLKTLNITQFVKKIQLNAKPMSSTYFTSNGLNRRDQDELRELMDENQDCIICCYNLNEVILKPCGHSGFCKSCTLEFVQKEVRCPMCKQNIESFIVFEFRFNHNANLLWQ